jgi:hypothetical protein
VLALTEFLRKSKVVGAYLEFFGRRRILADARRPRDDLEHGARVRRHRGDVLHRRKTIDYLRLTGRTTRR